MSPEITQRLINEVVRLHTKLIDLQDAATEMAADASELPVLYIDYDYEGTEDIEEHLLNLLPELQIIIDKQEAFIIKGL